MPTRYLKPGVRDSEAIDRLSPLAECLFYRLLVTVDDFGRFDARPAMVKAACFPIKESVTATDCESLMVELDDAGLILLYVVDEKPYLQMLKWDNAPRAKESKYLPPPGMCMQAQTVADKPERKAKAAPELPSIALPDWVPADAWADYIDMRKRVKKPMTQRAMLLAIDKLADLMRQGHAPKAVLEQSVMNSWQGLFEVKGGSKGGGETAYQRQMRNRVAEATGGLLARGDARNEVIDATPTTAARRLG